MLGFIVAGIEALGAGLYLGALASAFHRGSAVDATLLLLGAVFLAVCAFSRYTR